jgi:NADH-quinone oxidoreductase subunit L
MFDDPRGYMWLIPLLPLLASAFTAFFGPRFLRQNSHWPCIVAAGISCVLSMLLLVAVCQRGQPEPGSWTSYPTLRTVGQEKSGLAHYYLGVALEHQGKYDQASAAYHRALELEPKNEEARERLAQLKSKTGPAIKKYYQWIQTDTVDIGFTLRADGLTAIMLVTVTFVGSLIAIYSAGYMRGDEGYARYFAEVALFLFAMTGLVLADNFILLYSFWEGVGLCSYLLIGFWFTKPSAAAAARKAFLVTRIGDVGMFIGILVLWMNFGHQLDYDTLFGSAEAGPVLTAACLLLFCGAVGKSAQFPLHVWLPDAMEGPSPVSALIHAATMVTAGVYLVARCTSLFVLSPEAQLVVACIGAFTALLAALMALTQPDLKKVLAYSTISQLGYMFLALGCGIGDLATFAVTAAIFHLFTHAFFKALLFLAAGSVMHAMGNVIDMRSFGGLRRVLPTTHWTFLCGAAALSGIPLLSGFWSKDEILDAAYHASGSEHWAHVVYLILWISALATAGLTAFYTFRAYFLTFWGEERIPPEAGHHAHESPPVMLWPMMILAVGAVGVGMVVQPFNHAFGQVLELTRGIPEATAPGLNWGMMGLSSLIALAGVGAAWYVYVRRPALAVSLARRNEGLYELSRNRFYLDELYDIFIVKPASVLAAICRAIDHHLVDGLVNLVGNVPRFLGMLFRPIQNGLVQFYALAMVLGLTVFLLSLLMR